MFGDNVDGDFGELPFQTLVLHQNLSSTDAGAFVSWADNTKPESKATGFECNTDVLHQWYPIRRDSISLEFHRTYSYTKRDQPLFER